MKHTPIGILVVVQIFITLQVLSCFFGQNGDCGLGVVGVFGIALIIFFLAFAWGLVKYTLKIKRGDRSKKTKFALFSVIIIPVLFLLPLFVVWRIDDHFSGSYIELSNGMWFVALATPFLLELLLLRFYKRLKQKD